ncbi:N-formylglutamate amidohydrolase [Promicromonospora sukumoe]|uniref:N-formylglutamate amidohydrolase n=1 Tax=Promicromonospora sukumoe TaxID=88382 RepID=A0A7W3PBZ8_9MICO|nr:N-formylglutamate amidohydrolase [Promicromonospora sukumoe]MBA8806385.1 N-formylglutamate amidohydrolase [Promicromonospora sukumoe]
MVDIPHAGRIYPSDFEPLVEPNAVALTEDRLVDVLFAPLMDHARYTTVSRVGRSYLDVNRPRDAGSGVFRRRTLDGRKLQADVGVDAARKRLTLWDAYHKNVDTARRRTIAQHGWGVHLNLHSFPSTDWHTAGCPPMPFEIEVGDLNGRTGGRLTRHLVRALHGEGFRVGVNETFKGGEIVRRGRTEQAIDTIQLEVRRDLYLRDDLYLDWSKMISSRRRLMRAIFGAVSEAYAQPSPQKAA